MFERYSERARRTLFFARYEASQLGDHTIQVEHILLGLVRESKGAIDAIFSQWKVPPAQLRQQLEARAPRGEKFSTSIEIPFSRPTQRVLNVAAEEADRLAQPTIEPEHLLLAVVRAQDSPASQILAAYGMTAEELRKYLATHPRLELLRTGEADARAARRSIAAIHIQRVMELVRHLEHAEPNTADAHDLVVRIGEELAALERSIE